jgi:hypothetical protein
MLLAPTPLVLLSLVPGDAAPKPAAASLEALLAPLIAAPEPWQRGTRRAWEPSWLIAAGVHGVSGDYDAPQNADAEEDPAYSLDLVFYNWDGERGIGLEVGLIANSYDVDVTAIDTETVDSFRALIGLRLADRGPTDTFWIPYLRGGLMYRMDSGDVVDDDGIGWYLGGGIDFRLGQHFAITPQLLYSDSSSLNSQEWIFGVLAGIGF